jgi:hypothetical protein
MLRCITVNSMRPYKELIPSLHERREILCGSEVVNGCSDVKFNIYVASVLLAFQSTHRLRATAKINRYVCFSLRSKEGR